jgi:hypothetical protein
MKISPWLFGLVALPFLYPSKAKARIRPLNDAPPDLPPLPTFDEEAVFGPKPAPTFTEEEAFEAVDPAAADAARVSVLDAVKPSVPSTVPASDDTPAASLPARPARAEILAPAAADDSHLEPPRSVVVPFKPKSPQHAPAPGPQSPRPLPAGYDPVRARADALKLSAHLTKAGVTNYDRKWVARWQTWAGLKSDKMYGPDTRGALLHYGAKNAPIPFTRDKSTHPYTPPEQRK